MSQELGLDSNYHQGFLSDVVGPPIAGHGGRKLIRQDGIFYTQVFPHVGVQEIAHVTLRAHRVLNKVT